MAYRLSSMDEHIPFEQQIRSLSEETLLDIWEEVQQVQRMLSHQHQRGVVPAIDYERIIVAELQRRCVPSNAAEAPIEAFMHTFSS